MTGVVLFHHTQGLTDGVQAFADDLRAAGHTVTAPDLFEGRTFPTVEAGMTHAEDVVGMDEVVARGVEAAAGLPGEVVYAGFSMGVLPAQKLAQTKPGALGVVLYHGGVPATLFGDAWPDGLPLEVHQQVDDALGELDVSEQLVEDAGGRLFVYAGSEHLVTDRSLPAHDPLVSAIVLQRTLVFLARVG